MPRSSYVYRDGKVWLRGTEPPSIPVQRSGLPCPNIRPDGMSEIRSMHDGRPYDSRSGYYKSLERDGYAIVEESKESFEARPEFKSEGVEEDISRAIDQLESAS